MGDIAISGATSLSAPGQVTDLTLTADPNGAEKVTVKFRAPSVTLGGATLTALDKVEGAAQWCSGQDSDPRRGCYD